MLIDNMKAANLQARKDKNVNLRDIYTIIINKFMQAEIDGRVTGKVVGDDELVRIIQKSIKELQEESANYAKVNNAHEVENLTIQINALSDYLPKMLSKEEVVNIISGLEDKSIQSVMRFFKENYGNSVDMKIVNEVIRTQ